MTTWARLAVVGTVVTFGFGNVIGAASTLTGPQMGFWRFLIASVGYLAVHRVTTGPVRWADIRAGALTGIALGLEIALFFMSLQNTTVANTTLIASMTPLVLLVVAARRFGEIISRRLVAATGLALVGVAVVVWGSSGFDGWSPYGDSLAVLALLVYSLYFIVGKTARARMPGFTLQTVALIAGTPVLGVMMLVESGPTVPTGREWLDVAGLIALPTTGHLLINWSHRYVTLTYTSLIILAVPVWSVVCAVIFLDRSVATGQIVGGAVVLTVLAYAVVETARLQRSET